MKRVYTLYLLIMVFLAGCASPGMSTRQYQPPEPNKIENEKKVAKSFDETWDVLVAGLTKSVYVINNIDKASRIINFFVSPLMLPNYTTTAGPAYRNYSRGKENHRAILTQLQGQWFISMGGMPSDQQEAIPSDSRSQTEDLP